LDPTRRKAWRCTLEGMNEVSVLRTEQPETVVPLGELFDADELFDAGELFE
jgi:hypothetical protein